MCANVIVRMIRQARIFLNAEPEESPLGEALTTAVQNPSAFWAHLESLRKHLLRMLIVVGLCLVFMFAYTPRLIELLTRPIGGLERVNAIEVTESVGVYMRVALLGAITLASPYIAFELWMFVAPALHGRERKIGLVGIPLATVLFVAGMLFAYKVMLPAALPFLLNFMSVPTVPRLVSYINFVAGVLFWVGVAFEFPLVVYVLAWMGLVSPQILARQWRWAVIIIAVLAAAITPTVDPVNMTLVMVPMIFLYFLGIGLSYAAVVGRKARVRSSN